MKTLDCFRVCGRIPRSGPHAVLLSVLAGVASLLPSASWAGGTVTNCTESALHAAMAGGGTVTFGCNGTITLASTITVATDTLLDATGHQVAISGGNAVRGFYVNTNARFSVINLTIANGRSTDGAGIFNDGGMLTLLGVTLRSNATWTSSGLPQGGALLNRGGTVNATNCTFIGNVAQQTNACNYLSPARGGAVRNESGGVNLANCLFTANCAQGAPGAQTATNGFAGQDGCGGAVDNSGVLNAINCTFIWNSTTGGEGGRGPNGYAWSAYAGGAGGAGDGGAICNSGALTMAGCTLSSNSACGGVGGVGSSSMSYDFRAIDGGNGGAGGHGNGGALFNGGSAKLVNSTFALNSGAGAQGGRGGGGGRPNSPDYPGGKGGNGGTGGNANGAALFNGGTVDLVNCTIAENTASGASGGPGGGGGGGSGYRFGGEGGEGGNGGFAAGFVCSTTGQVAVTNCTMALNRGQSGLGGSGGAGGWGVFHTGGPGLAGSTGIATGGFQTAGGRLLNTLVASNTPSNCSGTITDAGHNLSSDASCAFTNTGSLNNTEPKLSPLADNGGPTPTMALLPGSPAMDAGDTTAAPPTDQRGGARPAGTAPDIGAYEYGSLQILRIGPPQPGAFDIALGEVVVPSCRLLTSTNLADWLPMATNQISADGAALFHVRVDTADAQRFYRVALP